MQRKRISSKPTKSKRIQKEKGLDSQYIYNEMKYKLHSLKSVISFSFYKKIKKLKTSKQIASTTNFTFNNLSATSNAENIEAYEEALDYALSNNNIKNIAVTGTFGSGKTSLIKTYQLKRKLNSNILFISLATFDESVSVEKKQEEQDKQIEKSILQQLIYSQSKNALRYSRFDRITKPRQLEQLLVPSIFILWLISGTILYNSENVFFKLPIAYWSSPKTWSYVENKEFWILTIVLAIFLVISFFIARRIYQNIYKIRLSKFSLKGDIEIEEAAVPNESILNKHLDEVLYFFEETSIDTLIIEDLDRFGSPDIFIKLREINKLVNDYSFIKRQKKTVRFIYAIKDAMFVNESRVKFFDFIIPVIPIINSSNSYDRIVNLVKKAGLSSHFDNRFLREISLYLYDLRLIHNIFNEFQIYSKKLPNKRINSNKLFAMIVYKNVYASDFEKLHMGIGVLARICENKRTLIQEKRNQIDSQIIENERLIQQSKDEQIGSVKELIYSYVGYIASNIASSQDTGIFIETDHISFAELAQVDSFNRIKNASSIKIGNQSFYRQAREIGSFAQISEAIHP